MASATSSPGISVAPAQVASGGWYRAGQRVLGRDWVTAYCFVLPMVLLLFGLIGYPFSRAVWLSFHNAVGTRIGNFVGIDNYWNLWTDSYFSESLWISVVFTVSSVAIKFALGLSAALLLHHIPKFGAVLGGLVLLPYVIPESVRALAWRVMLDPLFGAGNYIIVNMLGLMSKGPEWLTTPQTALPTVILVNIWAGTPFFIILLLAGLKAIDNEQYDAAAVDGANAWRRFLHITLPGLQYVIIVATLLSAIFTFNGFTLTYLLTGGGPGGATKVYPILAFEAVKGFRYGYGSAVALTIAPFLFIMILILGRFMMRQDSRTGNDDGATWKVIWTALLPIRLVTRGLVAAFWAINEVVETILGAVMRVVRPSGSRPLFRPAARRAGGHTVMYVLLTAILLFELLPFYFIFVTSFKSTAQISAIRSMFWPDPWVTDHFVELFTRVPFVDWYWNTIQVTIASTLLSVFVASLGAYGLVRLRWRGSSVMGSLVLIAYLMPGVMLLIPLYYILVQLQLINKVEGLMVVYPSIVLPFATWLMMGYYRSIPEELEDAAMIDGCTRFGAFWRIVLPLTRPALLAVALFAVTQAWNEFLYAYTFLTSARVFTVPVGLAQLIVGDVQPWGLLMAGCLLTAFPVVIIYMLGQRFMVAGLTAGSVKG